MKNRNDVIRFSRNKRIVSFGKKYQERIAPNSALESSFNKLALINAEIMSNDRLVQKGSKSLRLAKYEARDALAATAVFLGSAAFSFGFDTGNTSIQTRAGSTPVSSVNKMSEPRLIEFVKDMIKILEENIGGVKRYLVTPEFLGDAKKKILAFEKSISVLAASEEEIIKANARIKELLSQSAAVISKELHIRMAPYIKSDPELYKEYTQAARIPVDEPSEE